MEIFSKIRFNGKLCDDAPILLKLIEIPKPQEMTGNSLFVKK
jgi:bisphosphoglycerate-independent phosphoglycerate mutase (AlkP superfamily)